MIQTDEKKCLQLNDSSENLLVYSVLSFVRKSPAKYVPWESVLYVLSVIIGEHSSASI